MILESIFIVRGGFWGEEYDFKLLFAVVAITICILDWKWKDRKDYFWVFLTGFIFWTGVELLLQHFTSLKKYLCPLKIDVYIEILFI